MLCVKSRTVTGRVFHVTGPVTAKLCGPYHTSRVREVTNINGQNKPASQRMHLPRSRTHAQPNATCTGGRQLQKNSMLPCATAHRAFGFPCCRSSLLSAVPATSSFLAFRRHFCSDLTDSTFAIDYVTPAAFF